MKLWKAPKGGEVMKDYMSAEELQEYFSISKNTLQKWRKAGLRFIKIGGKILFQKEDIDAFFEGYKVCEYQR